MHARLNRSNFAAARTHPRNCLARIRRALPGHTLLRAQSCLRNHFLRRIPGNSAQNQLLNARGIGRSNIDNWVGQGLTFGIGCFAAVALPMCLSILVLMRVHQGVIYGMLLDWLASSIAAGLICAYTLGR